MRKHVSIGWFSKHILQKPLYWYQELIGDAIIESVLSGAGRTYTVIMSRQSGKNQLSACLEAYLMYLFQFEGGNIIKAAPT